MAASMAALAQPPPAPEPTAFTVKNQTAEQQPATNQLKVLTPLNYNLFKAQPRTGTDKIVRVEGMSSQPWYRMAGTKPGWSAFPAPEQRDPSFNLFWIGAGPQR